MSQSLLALTLALTTKLFPTVLPSAQIKREVTSNG